MEELSRVQIHGGSHAREANEHEGNDSHGGGGKGRPGEPHTIDGALDQQARRRWTRTQERTRTRCPSTDDTSSENASPGNTSPHHYTEWSRRAGVVGDIMHERKRENHPLRHEGIVASGSGWMGDGMWVALCTEVSQSVAFKSTSSRRQKMHEMREGQGAARQSPWRRNTGAAGLKRNGPVVAQWNKSQGSGRSRQGSDWPKLAMQNNARWRCTRGWWWDSIIKGSNTTAVWPFAIKGDLFDLSKVFDHFIWDWPWMDTPQMILVMTMRYWENEVWGVKRILGREIFRQTHVRKVFLLLVIIWRHVWSWRW